MIYWPFDSIVSDDGEGNLTYDREFNSANLRKIFSMLYTNGIAMSDKSDALQVVPSSGMSVAVKSGSLIIEGAMGKQEEDLSILIDTSSDSYTRIDTIVARLNTNISGRAITIEYIKGIASNVPSVPAITRSGGIYDLRLAIVRVPAGATTITGSMITDTRLSSDCGIATARPQKVDTQAIFDQYQASLNEYMHYVDDCINETVAGDLQNQITSLSNTVGSHGTSLSKMENTIGETSLSTTAKTLTGAINELLTAIKQPILKSKWVILDNISISSNWMAESSGRNINISGYTAVAIRSVGVLPASSGGKNSNWVVPTRVLINNTPSGDTLNYYFWNQHPSDIAKVKLEICILYVRKDLVQLL